MAYYNPMHTQLTLVCEEWGGCEEGEVRGRKGEERGRGRRGLGTSMGRRGEESGRSDRRWKERTGGEERGG